jgi:hypothetical protein
MVSCAQLMEKEKGKWETSSINMLPLTIQSKKMIRATGAYFLQHIQSPSMKELSEGVNMFCAAMGQDVKVIALPLIFIGDLPARLSFGK